MAEEADVQSEITLDDFNADEPAKADPSPAKEEPKATPSEAKAKAEAKPEPKGSTEPKAEGKEETKADDTAVPPDVPLKDEAKPDGQEKPAEDETPPEDKPTRGEAPTKADERKTQLNQEIRDLVSQRNAIKAEVQKANEVYQPATEDELTEQGLSATDAKVEALRQQMEVKDYNERVSDAQLTLSSEAERVLNDFPMFNPDNESYDKELAESAAELLEGNLIVDTNTQQIIGSNVSPYSLYKTLARASGISTVKGQLKGQADTEKQLASVDANSNAAPPSKPKDALMELWTSDD